MYDYILYVFMQKKSYFNQIKYFKLLKRKIKLKKVTFLFVSFHTFDLTLAEVVHQTIDK